MGEGKENKFAALISIGAEVGASVKGAFGVIEKSMGKLETSLKGIEKSQSGVQKLTASIASLGSKESKLKQASADLEAIKKEMQAAGGPSGALTAKFDRQRAIVDKLTASIAKDKEGIEKLSTGLQKAGIDTNHLGSEFDRLSRKAERTKLLVEGFDKVHETFGEAENLMHEFAENAVEFGAVVGGAGFGLYELAESTAEFGEHVEKTAASLGVGVKELQRMEYAGKRSAMTLEETDSALIRFQVSVGKARSGTGQAAKELDALGISATGLSKLPLGAALGVIADRLEKVGNQADKARVASALFGRESGIKMLNVLKGGTAAMAQLAKQADATGNVLGEADIEKSGEFVAKLIDMKLAIQGVKNTFGVAVMPVLTEYFQSVSEYLAKNRAQVEKWAESFAKATGSIIKALPGILEKVEKLTKSIISGADKVAHFVGGWKNLAIILAAIKLSPMAVSLIQLVAGFAKAAFSIGKFVVGILGLDEGFAALGLRIGTLLGAIPGIGWAVAGVAAVVGTAAFLIWKNWDKLVAYWQSIWPTIKPSWDKLTSAVGQFVQAVGEATSPLRAKLGELFSWLGEWLVKNLPGFLTMAIDNATRAVQLITDYVGAVIQRIDAAKKFLESAADFISSKFTALMETFHKVFSWNPIEAVKAAWTPALDWIKSKVDWVADAGKKVGSFFNPDAGKDSGDKVGPAIPTHFDQPIQFGGGKGANVVHHHDNRRISFTIHAAPGQSPKSVADAVMRRLSGASSSNGALYDDHLVPA